MKKIHIPRKAYIIAIASFYILAILGSGAFFLARVGEKWYDPVEVGRVEIGNQGLSDIEIQNNSSLVYVSKTYRGFDIYDIEDPTDPTRLGTYSNLEQLNRGLFYADDRIYLLASTSMQIIDVSNPTSPELLGNYTTYENVQNVHVVDNVAYLMTFNWLRVLNISNPANVSVLYSLQMHFGDHDVVVRDDIAYVASNLDGLVIFNVTDPSQPIRITNLEDYGEGVYWQVTATKVVKLDGDRLFIIDGVHNLVAFDITNPAAPTKLFRYVSGPPPEDFAVRGDLAYIPNRQNGVEIVGISDIEDVERIGRTPYRYLTIGVVVYENLTVSISSDGMCLTEIVEGAGFNPWKQAEALYSLEGLWKGIGVITIVSYLIYRVQKSELLE